MKAIERAFWLLIGALVACAIFWTRGSLSLSGDFQANIAGASIGGAISVGLAVTMFRHERRLAARDAIENAKNLRADAIREALRHVRSIQECVVGAKGVTINNLGRISSNLHQACELTRRALGDANLTDFPLRMAMTDAEEIGRTVAAQIEHGVQAAHMQDANTIYAGAARICDPALSSIKEIIDDYTKVRTLPSIA